MPTIYEVQAPDGTIFEIEGPDDATDAQVAEFAATQFSAPKGNAGAAPEPVAAVGVPSGSPVSNLPEGVDIRGAVGLPRDAQQPATMSAVRAFGDTMTLNTADEIGSAIQSGEFFSGPEYDRILAENAALRAADAEQNPNAQAAGQVLGVIGGMALPAGVLGQVAGLPRQMAVGAGLGAGTNMFAGAMGSNPGERLDNLEGDALIGAGVGLIAPGLAAVGRRGVQAAGVNPQSAADDAIRDSGLDPNALRARAADYQAATGRGARLVDILTPDEAQRFTATLSRSRDARSRVLTTNLEERAALPDTLSGAVQQPAIGPAQATAIRKADDKLNYGAVENSVFPVVGADRAVLENDIMPYVSLPKATADKIAERFDQNALTGDDLVVIRKALDRFNKEKTNSGKAYEDIVAELDAIIENVAPALNAARKVSAANRAFTEGTKIGRSAAVPGKRSGEAVVEVQTARSLQKPGIAPGTRSGILDQFQSNPSRSYALARELETNPAYQAQLRAALPQAEADALIAFATAQKKSLDNFGALTRIPPDKMDELLDSFEGMTDAVVGLGAGAGGAFKAGMVNEIAKRVGLGRGAANKLADDLLNPNRRERAIALLEKAGLPKTGLREVAQGLFLSTANAVTTSGRDDTQ